MMSPQMTRLVVRVAVLLAAGACGTSRPPPALDGAGNDAATGNDAADAHPSDAHPPPDGQTAGDGDVDGQADGGVSDATAAQDRNAFPDEGIASSDSPNESTITATDHEAPELEAGD
jgi:hypothetical protein